MVEVNQYDDRSGIVDEFEADLEDSTESIEHDEVATFTDDAFDDVWKKDDGRVRVSTPNTSIEAYYPPLLTELAKRGWVVTRIEMEHGEVDFEKVE